MMNRIDYIDLLYSVANAPDRNLSAVYGEYSPSAAPNECSHHGVIIGKGNPCHRCACLLMFDASITANVKAGDTAVAIAQLRFMGK